MRDSEKYGQPLGRARWLGLLAASPLVAALLWISARSFGIWATVGMGIMFGSALIAGTCSKMSLRSVFGGTFWIAVCFACYTISQHQHRYYRPWSFWIPENVLMLVMMWSPFVAAGAFFGRSLIGAVIGVIAVAAFWFIWSLT
jgi:hypothetical protein